MNFQEIKKEFNKKIENDAGSEAMLKITSIVNDVGNSFLTMNGGELAEAQLKLAGYRFYLSEYIVEINRTYEILKLEIKDIRAREWDVITEKIKAVEGKVKNKEQIENVLTLKTQKLQMEQMLYETLYYKYRSTISSIDSILTAIVQRISGIKREMEKTC